jgi:hypothetical protein
MSILPSSNGGLAGRREYAALVARSSTNKAKYTARPAADGAAPTTCATWTDALPDGVLPCRFAIDGMQRERDLDEFFP